MLGQASKNIAIQAGIASTRQVVSSTHINVEQQRIPRPESTDLSHFNPKKIPSPRDQHTPTGGRISTSCRPSRIFRLPPRGCRNGVSRGQAGARESARAYLRPRLHANGRNFDPVADRAWRQRQGASETPAITRRWRGGAMVYREGERER